MRLFLISAYIGLITLCHTATFGQGIKFEELTMSAAMAKASDPANPKLIFMDCYTSWCIPCIEMAKMEFPKKVMGDYFNPKFVSVKFDMEKGEGKELAKKYNVSAYPTFLILNASGQEINRVVGKAGAEDFIEKVKAALDPKNSLAGLKAAYEAKKDMTNGLPYAKALYQNSKDPSPVLEELFDHAQEYERFSKDFIELTLGTVKFGSPFFRKIMLEKQHLDLAMGTEVINRIIFDKVRKDMYIIAYENGARYNVFFTPKEVEDIAYTISLLKLDPQEPENHICRIALFVVNKDLDGMIAYYKRYIWNLPVNTVFKGILDGILLSKVANATDAQKAAIKDYFKSASESYSKTVSQYGATIEKIK